MSKIATIPAPTPKWPAMSKEEQEEEKQQLLIRESLAIDEHGKVPSAAALDIAEKDYIARQAKTLDVELADSAKPLDKKRQG